ncbi:MAG: hypothetical protein AAF708_07830 [Deinococcota bacterium]
MSPFTAFLIIVSAIGTVIVSVGIAIWVVRNYNKDLAARRSVHEADADTRDKAQSP